ncbi:MAG: hypothetical protein FJ023_07135 [Chloroflexi bacterium]|nr:hypothetical protein [Chloroflexota bacterium]
MQIFIVDSDGYAWRQEQQQSHEGHGRLDPLGDLSVLREAGTPDLESLRDLGLRPDWDLLRDMTNPFKW